MDLSDLGHSISIHHHHHHRSSVIQPSAVIDFILLVDTDQEYQRDTIKPRSQAY
jgi:hypothetical protein